MPRSSSNPLQETIFRIRLPPPTFTRALSGMSVLPSPLRGPPRSPRHKRNNLNAIFEETERRHADEITPSVPAAIASSSRAESDAGRRQPRFKNKWTLPTPAAQTPQASERVHTVSENRQPSRRQPSRRQPMMPVQLLPGLIPSYSTERAFSYYIAQCPDRLKQVAIFKQIFVKCPRAGVLHTAAVKSMASEAMLVDVHHPPSHLREDLSGVADRLTEASPGKSSLSETSLSPDVPGSPATSRSRRSSLENLTSSILSPLTHVASMLHSKMSPAK